MLRSPDFLGTENGVTSAMGSASQSIVRRVVLVPLNEHIDIIYERFSISNSVVILDL